MRSKFVPHQLEVVSNLGGYGAPAEDKGGKSKGGHRDEGGQGDHGEGSGAGEEVPTWCDASNAMGAWMNYLKVKLTRPKDNLPNFV